MDSSIDRLLSAICYSRTSPGLPIGVNIRKLCDGHLTRGGRASPRAGDRSIIVDIAYRWIGSVVGFENNGSRGRDPSPEWVRRLPRLPDEFRHALGELKAPSADSAVPRRRTNTVAMRPRTAAADIQRPGVALFPVALMRDSQMAGVKPPNKAVAKL